MRPREVPPTAGRVTRRASHRRFPAERAGHPDLALFRHGTPAGVRLQGANARATHPQSRMLRIRIGRRWTRERGTAPHDSVSLELDGVALVDGAADEPL